MSPTEAIELLEKATASVNTNRAGHKAIQEAIEVLRSLIEKKKKADEVDKPA